MRPGTARCRRGPGPISRRCSRSSLTMLQASAALPVAAVRPPPGMCLVPGAVFTMGSTRFYPEEAPLRRVRVDAFLMDEVPVTNAAFGRFVAETGHVTLAETAPSAEDYPGMAPEFALAGSAVFDAGAARGAAGAAPWWQFRPGAD